MNRETNLKSVSTRSEPWDIIVIGGGATGAGCALDAASRSFDVLLLEQHDFGKGTSSRSTKLIHGGVRYLRQGNISLVREALKERGILLKNAPHVVHKQEFVIPCYSVWQKYFYGLGMKIYDLLAGTYGLGSSRVLNQCEMLEQLPNLDQKGLKGGVLYYDGQFDDTRLLIDILQSADAHGAAVLNYARVNAFGKDSDGAIESVEFIDEETGIEHTVRTRSIINATGVFCDSLRGMADENTKPLLTYSQGIHLVFNRKFLAGDAALMIPKTSDGRVLFCIPWNDHLLVGTTDTPVESARLEPKALDAEIDFVLETAGEFLATKPTRSDVLSVFAGIRPLIKSGHSEKTSALSRGHEIFVDASKMITITGGKWTTYRKMAEDAVNRAIEISHFDRKPCITETLKITEQLAGSLDQVGELLHPELPYTSADVVRAVRVEMVRTVEDVLARRTRALFLNAKAATEMAPKVAEIIAGELDSDKDWIKDQLVKYERTAQGFMIDKSHSARELR